MSCEHGVNLHPLEFDHLPFTHQLNNSIRTLYYWFGASYFPGK